MLTNYAIDLDQELLHRLVWLRSSPVDSRLVHAYAGQHHIRGVRHIDTEDVDEFGDGFP